jgi:hypothetical protein
MPDKPGRPPAYETAEQMQDIIDKYFKSCEGELLKDADDNIIFDKYSRPVIINNKPPTVTGLALALGFNSRLSLLNYQDKEEFVNTITRAKAKVEEYAESRLYDKDGANGAKFSLANNFKGWSEKQEVTATNLNVNSDLDSDLFKQKATPEELANADKLTGSEIIAIMSRK